MLLLLHAEGLENRRVAVEINGEIVPRSRHAETALADGDRITIGGTELVFGRSRP